MRPVTDIACEVAPFDVISDFAPSGDRRAGAADPGGERDVVLLGTTGIGKSATTAWLVGPGNGSEGCAQHRLPGQLGGDVGGVAP